MAITKDPALSKGFIDKYLDSDPKWIKKRRLEAFENFNQSDWLHFQRTNISKWSFTNFNSTCDVDSIISAELQSELESKNIIFCDFKTAIKKHEVLIQRYLMKAEKEFISDKFTNLNKSLVNSGFFLHIPADVEVNTTIPVTLNLSGNDAGLFSNIVIVAESHSKANIIIHYTSEGTTNNSLNLSLIDVWCKDGAKLNISTINTLSKDTVDVNYRRAYFDNDSALEWTINDFSEGKNISNNLNQLKGNGSVVTLNSASLSAGSSRTSITHSINHWGKHSASQINARTVVTDQATNTLNSITKIENGAVGSDGQQSGKVLILDPRAKGDANPILLIDENDVTAGHAASAGQIDPMQLYYLMSRGITKSEAQKLITHGFLDAIISNIDDQYFVDIINENIVRQLKHE